MRVIYVIHNLTIGGSETVVSNYLMELKAKGIEVALVEVFKSNTYLYERLKEAGMEIYSLFPSASDRKKNIFKKIFSYVHVKLCLKQKLNRVLIGIKPDIIHFHTNFAFMDRLNIDFSRCFFTFHTAVWRSIGFPTKRFKTALINSCKKGLTIIALSKDIKEDVMALIDGLYVPVIPNGIDITGIKEGGIKREAFCSEVNIPVDSFVVGHVGRFHPVKNHEKLLSIFEKIHDKKTNSYLILVGDGPSERVYRIKHIADEMRIIDNVRFLGLREDASTIMGAFDCLILPSKVEGFPLVLSEAQAHGVRCIVTDAVPDEAIINDNCFKLSIDENDEKWADLALSKKQIARHKSIMDIEIGNVIDRHIKEYEKSLSKCK